MELVLGGRASGKTDYVKNKYPRTLFYDENTPWEVCSREAERLPAGTALVLNHLHLGILQALQDGKSQEEILAFLEHLCSSASSLVTITDEVGCGIVPMDPAARRFREVTGRISTALAARAETVTRVQCGIPMTLKAPEKKEQTLLLLRHAKTPGNEKRRYIGKTEESLSEEGRRALEKTRAAIDALSLSSIALHVSPMRRCRETAEVLFPGIPQHIVPDLRETDFGRFEGKSAEDLSGDPSYQAWIDSGGTLPFPEGESRAQFETRTDAAFFSLLSDTEEKDKTQVFVVHGGTIMSVLSALTGINYYDFQIPNGDGYLVRVHRENGLFLPDAIRRLLP